MPLIALLVTCRFINNISFSQTTSYLMLLIIKNISSDININHSAFLFVFSGFLFSQSCIFNIYNEQVEVIYFHFWTTKCQHKERSSSWLFIFFRGKIPNILLNGQKCCWCQICVGQRCGSQSLIVVHINLQSIPLFTPVPDPHFLTFLPPLSPRPVSSREESSISPTNLHFPYLY